MKIDEIRTRAIMRSVCEENRVDCHQLCSECPVDYDDDVCVERLLLALKQQLEVSCENK